MATSTTARKINQRRALRALFECGSLTRAQLARNLLMTKTGLSNIIDGLIDEGLVLESHPLATRPARVGRPGTSLDLNASGASFLGAEIRPNQVTTTFIDMKCQVTGTAGDAHVVETSDPVHVIDVIERIVRERKRAGRWTGHSGVCLVVPGFVSRHGTTHVEGLGWRNVQVGEMLRKRFGENVAIENDANLAAFAEWYMSPPDDRHDLLMLALSTGAGAGLVSQGRIVRGYNGMAGEIGHIVLAEQPSGAFEAVPLIWEHAIGSRAVLQAYERRRGATASLAGFTDAVRADEAIARDLADRWALWMAHGILAMIYAYDPERIVVSGELSALFRLMNDRIRAYVEARLAAGFPLPTITTSRLGGHIASLGGAAFLHARFLDNAIG